MNILKIIFFSLIVSSLILLLLYINKNVKTFINIENNDIKMYTKLFGLLVVIIFIIFYIFSLTMANTNMAKQPIYTGSPPF